MMPLIKDAERSPLGKICPHTKHNPAHGPTLTIFSFTELSIQNFAMVFLQP